jgi:hypothetical protein
MHSVKLPEFGQRTSRNTLVSITSLRQVHRLVVFNLIVNLMTIFVIWRLR